jgi:GTP-binding protein HflX
LFATLDSSVGKIKLPVSHTEILVSDTIGFINNLPATLIDAFASTLMESIHADLLLQVIDVSDSNIRGKIHTVEKVLSSLGMSEKERIYVFNKTDKVTDKDFSYLQESYSEFQPMFISTKENIGIDELIGHVEKRIENTPEHLRSQQS